MIQALDAARMSMRVKPLPIDQSNETDFTIRKEVHYEVVENVSNGRLKFLFPSNLKG
jgi:hypothetical protein